ncbi:MAG: hypothetical protein ACYS1E_02255 [Planctomycetota bacterium]
MAALSRTTPEAPDASAYRRDHAEEPDAPKLQPGAAVTPVSLAAAMPGDRDGGEAPVAATDRDAVEPPEAPEALEPPDAAEPPESQETVEISEPLPPDDDADIDELMAAIEALEVAEVPDPAEAVEEAPAAELTEPEPVEPALAEPEPAMETPPLEEAQQPTVIGHVQDPDLEDGAPADEEPVAETLQAAAVEEPSAAEPADPGETLERLDDELAGDVDKMLQGEFESVDELLEGGFDEPEPVPHEPEAAVGTSTETGVVSEIATASQGNEPPAGDPGAGKVIDPRDFIDLGDPGAGPTAPEPPPTVAEEAPEPEVHAEPEPALEPEAEPEPVAAAATLEVDAGPQAKPPLIRALEWMNAPRRFLPPPARVIVDWVALSLVFWVPIVWLFALLVVGR